MRMAKNTKIVSLEGPPCDRCGCPTEIREHERITEKELAKQFYYSRWYNCPNQDCKTNVITLPEFRVWNVNEAQRQHDVVATTTEHRDSAERQVRYSAPHNPPSPAINPNAVFVKNGFKCPYVQTAGKST
jgi:hypothetical protein